MISLSLSLSLFVYMYISSTSTSRGCALYQELLVVTCVMQISSYELSTPTADKHICKNENDIYIYIYIYIYMYMYMHNSFAYTKVANRSAIRYPNGV